MRTPAEMSRYKRTFILPKINFISLYLPVSREVIISHSFTWDGCHVNLIGLEDFKIGFPPTLFNKFVEVAYVFKM